MTNWYPDTINSKAAPYYEAMGLLASKYAECDLYLRSIAVDISNCPLMGNATTYLGSISLHNLIKEIADKVEPVLKSEITHAIECVDSIRILRNWYCHAWLDYVDNDYAYFFSPEDARHPKGKHFKSSLKSIQTTVVEAEKIRLFLKELLAKIKRQNRQTTPQPELPELPASCSMPEGGFPTYQSERS